MINRFFFKKGDEMKKLTLVGVSLVATTTGHTQEVDISTLAKSSNVKPGQEIALITQNNEKF